ncbi:hypothetical protein F9802_02445 [Bacillus aerolatus]|uniref:Uncharacterized protein n=1 Tax=Bacillus aerolatus TaxID=2653354 RepID=A0A6I1FVR0_9BACI|nr:hypothetical protein [Bacillus aerolatus]KAB7709013.1 hypothetical protein F9802_02445 [Bacillus aerolatus]
MAEKQTSIVAIVTTKQENIKGGAPTFTVENKETLQKTSTSIAKILGATAHEINPDTIIIVRR